MPYPRHLKINPDFSSQEYIRVTPEIAGWKHLSFAARKIERGASWESNTADYEMAIVILGGEAEFISNRKSWKKIGKRTNVFSGMPFTVYIPRQTNFKIKALSDELDIGYGWAATDRDHPIQLVTPEMTTIEIRGGGNVTRQINNMIPPGFDCHRLVTVEVYTPSGNWSSYPPHKHDHYQVDEKGNLMIVGREKDVIIRGGQNIYPAEVENVIQTHPKIVSAALVAIPDKVMGERACAFIVLTNKEDEITLEELGSFLKGKGLSAYKIPERIEFIESMPLVSDAKIDKKVLKSMLDKKLADETR